MFRFSDSIYDLLQSIYDAKFRREDRCEDDYWEKEKYPPKYEEKKPCYYEEKRPCWYEEKQPREEEKWICKKEKFPCHEEKFPCPEKKRECCDRPIIIENKISCDKEKKHEEECRKHDDLHEPEEPIPDDAAEAARGREFDEDAYAYLFASLATGANAVASGADVPLNMFTVLDDVFFNPPAATVRIPGAYDILYSVNVATAIGTPTFIAIAINGVPQASTFIPIAPGTLGEFSGNAILRLNRNDTVTIRNVPGGSALTLVTVPAVGAQLSLVLLDPAKRLG